MTEQGRKQVDPLLEKALDSLMTLQAPLVKEKGGVTLSLDDPSTTGVDASDAFNYDSELLHGTGESLIEDGDEDLSFSKPDVSLDIVEPEMEDDAQSFSGANVGATTPELEQSDDDVADPLSGSAGVNETKTQEASDVKREDPSLYDVSDLEDFYADGNNADTSLSGNAKGADLNDDYLNDLILDDDDALSLTGSDTLTTELSHAEDETLTEPYDDVEIRDIQSTDQENIDLYDSTGETENTEDLAISPDIEALFDTDVSEQSENDSASYDALADDDISMMLDEDEAPSLTTEPESQNSTIEDEPLEADFDALMGLEDVEDNRTSAEVETDTHSNIQDDHDDGLSTAAREETQTTDDFADAADIMATMVDDADDALSFIHDDKAEDHSQLGPHSNPADLDAYLDNLEIPMQSLDNSNLDLPQAQGDRETEYNAGEKSIDSSAENIQAETSYPKDRTNSTEDIMSKENQGHQDTPAPQKQKLFAPLLLASLMGAMGGFGLMFGHQTFFATSTEQSVALIQQETERFSEQLKKLSDKANSLDQRLTQSSSLIQGVESNYLALKSEQSRLLTEQAKLAEGLSQVRLDAENYEAAMVSRLETLLSLTKTLSGEITEQESRLRDTVFRETMAALEQKSNGGNAADVKKMVSDLQKTTQRLEQIEVNLDSQKKVLSLIGDETEYVKSRLGELELNKIPVGTTQAEKTEQPKPAKKTPHTEKVISDRATPKEDPSWQVSAPNVNKEITEGYTLIGVLQKSPGVFEIYLQSNQAKNATEYETYTFSPAERSVIPGYGVIQGVQAVTSNTTVVPYQILTERGAITGRPRKIG